ncbi:MAG: thermonuclease family protein [Gammaproteobacteria bacterium]|nr:thermonuclease family protein [Gammaproteobacteria bacterium]
MVLAGGSVGIGLSVDNIIVPSGETIVCSDPYVIDGDTLDCNGTRIRLAGIDAPEKPGHCREGRSCTPGDPIASGNHLRALTRGPVVCVPKEMDHYGRTVARCRSGERDISCAMIADGYAVRRYGYILCPG